jgi:phosphohistidine phosphatase
VSKRLFVLRHAKSSWDDPSLADHDRPLAARGRKAAELLAEHLRTQDIHPIQVLCSSSRRTRETLDGIAPDGERLIEPELYSATGQEVLERLRRVPEKVDSVMVVGHNPAMQLLVLHLASRDGMGDGGAEVERKFPTGALATLTFNCAWSELESGCATLVAFVRPRALEHH